MKNIKIIDDCLVKGKHVDKGEILENVDNSTAALLLTSGRAVIYDGKEKPAPAKKAAKKATKKKDD